jgi:hypothetical protein
VGVRVKKLFPALKHGGYSALGLLPGEDRAAFEKLHRELRAELRPDGPLEEDIVANIARLLWRKQNLETFRRAEAARERYSAIRSEMVPSTTAPNPLEYLRDDWTPPTPAEVQAATEAVDARAREELGDDFKFVEMGDRATPAQMLADLEVEERLDAMIRKRLSDLAQLKAFAETISSTKSLSATPLPRISGPKKAA